MAANENSAPVWVHNDCLLDSFGLDKSVWKKFDADVSVTGGTTSIYVNMIEAVDEDVAIPVSQYRKVLDGIFSEARKNGSQFVEISGIAGAESVERLFRARGTFVIGSNAIEVIRIAVP